MALNKRARERGAGSGRRGVELLHLNKKEKERERVLGSEQESDSSWIEQDIHTDSQTGRQKQTGRQT